MVFAADRKATYAYSRTSESSPRRTESMRGRSGVQRRALLSAAAAFPAFVPNRASGRKRSHPRRRGRDGQSQWAVDVRGQHTAKRALEVVAAGG